MSTASEMMCVHLWIYLRPFTDNRQHTVESVSVYEGAADLCVWLQGRLFTGAHCPLLGPPAG